MSIDNTYDGKITIGRGEGISQAIRDELGLTQAECNNLGLSIWTEIMEQVKEQKKTSSEIYADGDDLSGPANENFVVQDGNVIEFSRKIWNNIVRIINDSNKLSRKLDELAQDDTNPPGEDLSPPPREFMHPYKDFFPPFKDTTPPISSTSNEQYSHDNKLILEIVPNGDDIYCYYRYDYDQNGNKTQETCYNPDGRVSEYCKYEYDQNGNVIQQVIYSPDGNVSKYNRCKYDQNGKNTQITRYNQDGSVSEYYRRVYDQDGNEIQFTHYNQDGSVSSYYRYEYDQDGNCKMIQYDPNGKLVKQD